MVKKMKKYFEKIDKKVKEYIENNVFPEYEKNEQGYGINHIEYVIRRSFELIEQNDLDVDINMVYVIAAYHDIGHHIDRKNHEKISAEIMSKDENLKEFFDDEQLRIIEEAIEDHRASSEHDPRSIYGKIVSSADRNNTVEQCLERTYTYGKKHEPEATEQELYERSYDALNRKFGYNGYAKFYFKDEQYENFLRDIRKLLEDKEEFCKVQEKYIKDVLKL